MRDGNACPRCGGYNVSPADYDCWWCSDCQDHYPTRAFCCQFGRCFDWEGSEGYCDKHRRLVEILKSNPQFVPQSLCANWDDFQRRLAAWLRTMVPGQRLILARTGRYGFVQFAVERCGFRAESISNTFLPKRLKLNEKQLERLATMQWNAPTSADDELPKSGGSPNYFRDYSSPVPFEDVASLAVCTLTEVLQVQSPEDLTYKAFHAESGEEIFLPCLGLQHS